jgi:hypothetical protein
MTAPSQYMLVAYQPPRSTEVLVLEDIRDDPELWNRFEHVFGVYNLYDRIWSACLHFSMYIIVNEAQTEWLLMDDERQVFPTTPTIARHVVMHPTPTHVFSSEEAAVMALRLGVNA